MLELKTNRQVTWDTWLIEKSENLTIPQHKPEHRGPVFRADAPWEGNTCCYFDIINEDMGARLYYRGSGIDVDDRMNMQFHGVCFCLCYTQDGKHFERVPVDKLPFGVFEHNNIVSKDSDDNFTVFYDSNPDCPADERYKALAGTNAARLNYFASADGLSFRFVRALEVKGAFDSMNVAFWDEQTKQYRLYYRGLHDLKGNNFRWGEPHPNGGPIRDIRLVTSPDFVTWSEGQRISFGENAPDVQLYTNQIRPYYRAPQVLLGIPTRYCDRVEDKSNFDSLPDRFHRGRLTDKWDRSGTAMTDCCLMTSRDGVNFRRMDEAFITPGPERQRNWYYGDCYTALGMMETKADREGAPNEISLYMGEDYRAGAVTLVRYALRLDGFFSWHGDYAGAEVLTRPFTFEGNSLSLNFATSALGSLRIRILDENGEEIPGCDSGNLFGDSVERIAVFEKNLAELNGKTVRLKITLSDADLYSFRFQKDPLNK